MKTRAMLGIIAIWLSTVATAITPILDDDPLVVELIVSTSPGAESSVTPENLIHVVEQHIQAPGLLTPAELALYARLSGPTGARWLLEYRQPEDYIAKLRASDPTHPELRLQHLVLLEYASSVDRIEAQKKLAVDKAFASAIPNGDLSLSARVNDYYVATGPYAPPTLARYQWGLEAMRTMSPYSAPAQLSGWDLAIGYGYVAIVDSGIDTTHSDLQRNYRSHFSQAFHTGCGGLAGDPDERGLYSTCPNNIVGHGTHVAGIVGASPHNSIGVAGVCADCSLIIARIRQSDTALYSNIVNGYYHAVIRGAQVVNHSGGGQYLEGVYGVGIQHCSDLPAPYREADGFCAVLELAERRQLVVVAASGNNNNNAAFGGTQFPAREPTVVSVAGTTYPNDDLWENDGCCGSMQGSDTSKVDFVAPAKKVVSTFYRGGTWNATLECTDAGNAPYDGIANGYDECTGTSMAAPHVSAVIAILRSVNPILSRSAIVNLASQSARTVAVAPSRPNGYKLPDHLAGVIAAHATNGSITPVFSMVNSEPSGLWNRFFTVAPQMAVASIGGTMLPTTNSSTTPVPYIPDPSAPPVSGYSFPDASGHTPRAYFKVYTQMTVYGVGLLPLYRLSKLQDVGNGRDECDFVAPVPSKPKQVIHKYTTSVVERDQALTRTAGNCYRFDGIEGYVAPYNLGGMQELYRLYNPTRDAFILVPTAHVATAYALGFQSPAALGWVFAN